MKRYIIFQQILVINNIKTQTQVSKITTTKVTAMNVKKERLFESQVPPILHNYHDERCYRKERQEWVDLNHSY